MKNKKVILLTLGLILVVGTMAYAFNTNLLKGLLDTRTSGSEQTQGYINVWVTDEYGDGTDTGRLVKGLSQNNFNAGNFTYNGINGFSEAPWGGEYKLTVVANETYNVTANVDGYVSNTGSFTASSSTEMGEVPVLAAEGVENVLTLKYGYKVVVYHDDYQSDYDFRTATVTAGDLSTTCNYVEDNNYDRDQYTTFTCVVPLATSEYNYKVSMDGFKTITGEFTNDRTKNTDPQQVAVTEKLVEGDDKAIFGYSENYVTVTDENGAAILGLDENNFSVTEAGNLKIQSVSTDEAGVYKITIIKTDYTDYTLNVKVDGYVNQSIPLDDNTPGYKTSVSMPYGYVVYPVSEGDSAITDATVTAGSNYNLTCSESSGTYYCAVPLANTDLTFKVVASGYSEYSGTFSTDRTGNGDPQVVANVTLESSGNGDTLTFSDNYVTVKDEYGTAITGLTKNNFTVTEAGGLQMKTFTEKGSGVYKMSIPKTEYTDYTLNVMIDGYVSQSVALDDNTPDYATSVSMPYGYLVLPINSDQSAITGATVTAGSNYNVTCSESSGNYYCVIPLSNTDLTFKVVASGYAEYNGTFSSDRTVATDSKVTATAKMTTGGGGTDNDVDSDGDGLSDYNENNVYGTDPNKTDTDADNISDYEEVKTFGTDPNDSDTDNDGVPDGTEVVNGTDPLVNEFKTGKVDNGTCTDPFIDMEGHWAQTAVCILYQAGIVKGQTPTTYSPDTNVTRAEFLKMILLQGGYDPAYYSGLTVTKYSDVNVGDWYYNYVALADKYGFLWYPASGVWQPNEAITRGDAMLLSVRIAKLTLYGFTEDDSSFTDFDADSYQAYAIILGEQYGVIKGYDDGTFKPNNKITRAEAAKVINASKALFE